MRDIPLQNVPNQRVETTIDGVSYAIQLRTVQKLTVADVYADGKLLKGGVRCVPGQRLIPYRYLTVGGNFFWYCLNGDYPYYTQFGVDQQLVYLSDAELANLNGAE